MSEWWKVLFRSFKIYWEKNSPFIVCVPLSLLISLVALCSFREDTVFKDGGIFQDWNLQRMRTSWRHSPPVTLLKKLHEACILKVSGRQPFGRHFKGPLSLNCDQLKVMPSCSWKDTTINYDFVILEITALTSESEIVAFSAFNFFLHLINWLFCYNHYDALVSRNPSLKWICFIEISTKFIKGEI